MPSALRLIVCAALIAGCSVTQRIGSAPSPVVTEQTATPQPTATQAPTPRPTATPTADLARTFQVVYAWSQGFGDFVSYQVLIAVENRGTGWAQLSPFNSDYQVLDASGGLTATGSFTYAYPEFVGPGETAYLVNDGVEQNTTPQQFASVKADGRFDPVDGPKMKFTFSDLKLKKNAYSPGYTATGFVTADADLTGAILGVLCLAADGKPLGATTTNLVQNLTAGDRKGFETVTETPPLDPAHCVQLMAFGQDRGF